MDSDRATIIDEPGSSEAFHPADAARTYSLIGPRNRELPQPPSGSGGTVRDEPGSDSAASPDVIPVTPYSRLDSSTREPQPATVPYDSLNMYANINNAGTSMMNGIIPDQAQQDSGVFLSTRETTV